MPANLLIVVCFQIPVCAAVHAVATVPDVRTRHYWLSAAWFGLALGLLMDAVLGAHGLFAYLADGPAAAPVEPRRLPPVTSLLNAAASYGIAVATFGALGDRLVTNVSRPRFWLRAFAVAVTAGSVGIVQSPPGSVPMMLCWGLVIIGAGEILLLTHRIGGPLVAFLSGASPKPLLWLWGTSAAVGIAYELVNSVFPFWVWLPASDLPPPAVRWLVAVLGYVALAHPIAVFRTLSRRMPVNRR